MIGTASLAPWSVSGRRPPSAVSNRAPISQSGTVTRPIGLRDSEASPMQRAMRGVEAMRPSARRTPVPELPKSRSPFGLMRPETPTPWMCQIPSAVRSTLAPKACMALAVLTTSSPSRRPEALVSPTATAPNIKERCEIDLSPGTRKMPLRPLAWWDLSGAGLEPCTGNPG